MADILALVFKCFSESAGVNEVPWSAPALGTLVVGEHNLSRSVLLLAAVTAASESGLRVSFFTRTQIQSLPVALQRRVPSLNPGTLKKIKFCYPRTLEELLVQVAGLHESLNSSPSPPALLIVDSLEGYLCTPFPNNLHTSEQSSTAHLSALLCDTASFLTQVLEKQGSNSAPCRVIASFQPQEGTDPKAGEHSSADPVLDVLDRYFQVRCTLDQDRSYEATASGLKQVWNIFLSGSGMTNCEQKNEEKPEAGSVQEWKLLVSSDGLMEFKLSAKVCV